MAGEVKPGTAVEAVKTVTTCFRFAGQSLIVAFVPGLLLLLLVTVSPLQGPGLDDELCPGSTDITH